MPIKQQKYVDLDLNFFSNPLIGDISKVVDKRAIIQSVVNLVRTNHFERPFQPEIGSNIEKMLFENMSPVITEAIKRDIVNTINGFEPRVILRTVSVIANDNWNGYDVTIEFYINTSTEPIAISMFLERS